ncbi:hypothetical protein JNO04_14425 [Halomonas sp. MC140]|nr:hypothetical protein [Halomonas sp. MC140]MDN7133541.1 hypothetical protein [Halomonas sp. MC140]
MWFYKRAGGGKGTWRGQRSSEFSSPSSLSVGQRVAVGWAINVFIVHGGLLSLRLDSLPAEVIMTFGYCQGYNAAGSLKGSPQGGFKHR